LRCSQSVSGLLFLSILFLLLSVFLFWFTVIRHCFSYRFLLRRSRSCLREPLIKEFTLANAHRLIVIPGRLPELKKAPCPLRYTAPRVLAEIPEDLAFLAKAFFTAALNALRRLLGAAFFLFLVVVLLLRLTAITILPCRPNKLRSFCPWLCSLRV